MPLWFPSKGNPTAVEGRNEYRYLILDSSLTVSRESRAQGIALEFFVFIETMSCHNIVIGQGHLPDHRGY